jgi:predicted secreted protein
MRTVCVLLAAVIATACTPAQKAHYREKYNLDSPTLVRDAAIDGQTVTLKRGQALVVRLDSDPTTGMRWEMAEVKSASVIAPVQHDLVAKPGTDPVATNAPGEAVFRLRGINPGSQPIALEYRRPLEAATRTVRFEVVVL